MKRFAAAAVSRSNLPSCAAVARATRSAPPSAVTWLTKPTDCAFVGIDAAASEKQIAHDRVSQIALETRNSTETGNEAEAQLGKAKAGHFVGDDQIAGERQLEAASESDAVDGGDCCERSSVDCIHHAMNSFEEVADASRARSLRQFL